jgi:hypothetical protein
LAAGSGVALAEDAEDAGGPGFGSSFSADFLRVVQGLESRNFSRRDLVLVNLDLDSPFSSWLLRISKNTISIDEMIWLSEASNYKIVNGLQDCAEFDVIICCTADNTYRDVFFYLFAQK